MKMVILKKSASNEKEEPKGPTSINALKINDHTTKAH